MFDMDGTPMIFAIPAITTTKGAFRKKPEAGWLPAFDFLERWLIAEALSKNPNLVNTKLTHFLKNVHVTGLFNATKGEATSDSRSLARALW